MSPLLFRGLGGKSMMQDAIEAFDNFQDCSQATPASSRHSSAKDLETISSRDALEVAIANEQQGLHFYRHAVEVSEDETTRTVFARLAADEQEHLNQLQSEYDALRQAQPWLDDEPSLGTDPSRPRCPRQIT